MTSKLPSYYRQLDPGVRCCCVNESYTKDGRYWCCGNQEAAPAPSAPVDTAVSMMSLAEQEIVALLRKMVANQKEIIELLRDISQGLA